LNVCVRCSLGYLAVARLKAHRHLIYTIRELDEAFALAEAQSALLDVSQWETSIWMWNPHKVRFSHCCVCR
jgi:hypothetical protein